MAGKPIICTHCNGEMQQYSGPRYNRKVAGFFIIFGIIAVLFWIGMVLGIPLILIGLYMLGAKRDLWVCKECNTAIERFNIDAEKLGK
ncbi:MAG: hypothetical protein HQL14_00800 [Candidatus Omnitrophica bacterium]|nr:hypothetical protein [Candidatus Omnitrophota bacterium]